MRVENCCLALLTQILPAIDPSRTGVCIDVGVGTFAFYCELFAQLGFSTVAVEPLPIVKLRKLCKHHQITLLESCLSDQIGTQTLHMGRFANFFNRNFNSLAPDWFGSSAKTQQVPTIDFCKLVETIAPTPISCLKLDIEGWESVVLKQLVDLPETLLPKIAMFEYGGGGSRQQGMKGWSPKFLEGTLSCLKSLQQCRYGFSIMIDYAADAEVRVFDLQSLSLDRDTLFHPNAVYGNIISFHNCTYSEAAIAEICAPFNSGFIHRLIGLLLSSR